MPLIRAGGTPSPETQELITANTSVIESLSAVASNKIIQTDSLRFVQYRRLNATTFIKDLKTGFISADGALWDDRETIDYTST